MDVFYQRAGQSARMEEHLPRLANGIKAANWQNGRDALPDGFTVGNCISSPFTSAAFY